jgi:hypothetical protein
MTHFVRTLCVAAAVLVAGAAPALAQDTLATSRVVQQYEAQKKSAVLAGALEYAFPFAGYVYAGNWRRGLAPGALFLGGFLLVTPCAYNDLGPCSDNQQKALLAGAALIVVSKIWGVVGAAHTASDYNQTLRERLQIEPVRARDGYALRIGVQLRL